ncbi:hypothetical protein HYH03_008475 [Edaphochlamys debaryana]|uniref:BTB domain-containing protein n=1 Tax=Edaphochlamys debaryana TaxID=47281 RepID=A0A835Y163_9CHLO|nr:hypothetical protein HYH03_008475 [Edaphochlamys debaryana]|eukprot:KAG2493342.1 hypothetical protein HYH03_008475 [Edaphochlamys debaryana]
MSLSCSTLALEQPVRGLVVRPRPGGGGPDQTLVFLRRGEVHELLPGGTGGGYEIGPHLASVGGDSDMRLPAYDPDSQAVFYSVSGTAIGKLDASNRVSAGSEYFARLLAPGGGFAESGAAEVSLPDADSAAFAHLLSYMYCTSLGAPPQILALSPDLLRVTTLLAGRLLMGGAVAALMDRLAATVRPASVLSDLAWADAHGMTDLAERLRAHAVLNRKSLDPNGLEQLAEECPRQAAELLKSLAGRS